MTVKRRQPTRTRSGAWRGRMRAGAAPEEPPLTLPPVCSYALTCRLLSKLSGRRLADRVIGSPVAVE